MGQLGGEDLGLEDLWWPVQESVSMVQQAREDRALQVRLAFTSDGNASTIQKVVVSVRSANQAMVPCSWLAV